MRKLILCNIMSLDGYYEGPGRNVMVLPDGRELRRPQRRAAARGRDLARRPHDLRGLANYWPGIAGDAEARPVLREISRRNDQIDRVVICDTLTRERAKPWDDAVIVRRADAHRRIAALQLGSGGRHPGVRQPHALERPAGRRAG
jgi:hypothetical protein